MPFVTCGMFWCSEKATQIKPALICSFNLNKKTESGLVALGTWQAEGYKLPTHDVAISPSYLTAHLPPTAREPLDWSAERRRRAAIGRASLSVTEATPLRMD